MIKPPPFLRGSHESASRSPWSSLKSPPRPANTLPPLSPEYTWHKLGTYWFDTSSAGLVFLDGDAKVTFWGSAVDPGHYEVWIETAFEQPDVLRIGRVIAVATTPPQGK
jgi:hypothetical protein